MSECAVCGTSENVEEHHINGDETDDRGENRIDLCTSHHKSVHGTSMLPHLKDDRVLELKERLGTPAEMDVTCEHCGYSWTTRSVRTKATCPSCHRKTEKNE